MMSANRLLLRRLAAKPAMQQIGRRQHHLLSNSGSWNSTRHDNIINSRSTTVHLPTASFWSSWFGGDKDSKKDDAPATSNPEPEKSVEDPLKSESSTLDASIKSADSNAGLDQEDKVVPPEEVSTKATDSTVDQDEKDDGVPPVEVSSKATESTDGPDEKIDGIAPEEISTETKDSTDGFDEKADGIPPEEVTVVDGLDEKPDGDGLNKKDDSVPPEEVSSKATDSIDGLDEKDNSVPLEEVQQVEDRGTKSEETTDLISGLDKKDDIIPPEEVTVVDGLDVKPDVITPEEVTVIDGLDEKPDVIPPKKVSKKVSTGGPDKKHVVPPEQVIRTGFIKWLDFPKMCGIIVQDKMYRKVGPVKTPKVFIHFNDLNPEIREFIPRTDAHLLKPIINKEQRIQFQARAEMMGGKQTMKAFNVRYIQPLLFRSPVTRTGDIPVLHWQESLDLIRKAKASLGHDVYMVLANKSMNDKEKTAEKVNLALEKCNRKVAWSRSQIVDSEKCALGCKARLGEDIFDLLSNISTVDNIERKADEAYFRCLGDLSDLDLKLTPGQKQALKEYTKKRLLMKSFGDSF